MVATIFRDAVEDLVLRDAVDFLSLNFGEQDAVDLVNFGGLFELQLWKTRCG